MTLEFIADSSTEDREQFFAEALLQVLLGDRSVEEYLCENKKRRAA